MPVYQIRPQHGCIDCGIDEVRTALELSEIRILKEKIAEDPRLNAPVSYSFRTEEELPDNKIRSVKELLGPYGNFILTRPSFIVL